MAAQAQGFTVIKLYRDCLRLADYASVRAPGTRETLREQVRTAFRRNAGLSDPVAIEAAKEAAVRGLSNYMFIEAKRMAQEDEAREPIAT